MFDFISFLQLYDIIMTADNKSFITMFYIIAIVLLFIIRCRFPKSRSLTGVIRSRYDNHVLKIIRKYEKYDYKICKLSVDIEFLNNCLNHDLCPPFLKYKMSSKRLQTSDKYKISQRVFTQQETTFQTLMIEKVCEQLNKVKDDLRTVVSFFDCSHIANTLAESNIKTIKRVKGVQDYKIAELLGSTLSHDPKEVIYNSSFYILSETEKALLCKGLNFAIPPKKLKFENYILPFEILFRYVCHNSNKVSDDDCLLDLKCKIKDVGLSSFRWYNKKDHHFEI